MRKQQRQRGKSVSVRFQQFEQSVRQLCQPNEWETEFGNFRRWCEILEKQDDPRKILMYLEGVYLRYNSALRTGDEIYAERTRWYLNVVFEKMLAGQAFVL